MTTEEQNIIEEKRALSLHPMGSSKVYFERSCQGKKRYPDKKSAATSVNSQKGRHNGLQFRYYQCPDCNGYHLARLENRDFKYEK